MMITTKIKKLPKPYLSVIHKNGSCEVIKISRKLAEVLIAHGLSYGG